MVGEEANTGKLQLPSWAGKLGCWLDILARRRPGVPRRGWGCMRSPKRAASLGRDGADVHRKELSVMGAGVPVAPAPVPRAGIELLVRRKRVDHRRVGIAPAAVATLPVVSVNAVGAVKVEQGVLPVAGLVQPVELDVVDCMPRGPGQSPKDMQV